MCFLFMLFFVFCFFFFSMSVALSGNVFPIKVVFFGKCSVSAHMCVHDFVNTGMLSFKVLVFLDNVSVFIHVVFSDNDSFSLKFSFLGVCFDHAALFCLVFSPRNFAYSETNKKKTTNLLRKTQHA